MNDFVEKMKNRIFFHKYYEKFKYNFCEKWGIIHYWQKHQNFNIDNHIDIFETAIKNQ